MRKVVFVAGVIGATLIISPAYAKKPPEISGLALQQMQSRDYETGKSVSFPAVMTVLQDSGYRIQSADKDTGLITATASTKSKTTWAPFVGFGKSKKTPVVSAFIEDRGRGSRVRMNFILAKSKKGAYGMGWDDEEPILDPQVYRDAFERIDKEIFTRQALMVPTPPPVATVPVAAPAAAAVPTVSGLTPNPADMPSALTPEPKS
jgi:hypothetical protein